VVNPQGTGAQFGEAPGEFPAGLEAFDFGGLAPPRDEQAGLVALVPADRFHGGFFAGFQVFRGAFLRLRDESSIDPGG